MRNHVRKNSRNERDVQVYCDIQNRRNQYEKRSEKL